MRRAAEHGAEESQEVVRREAADTRDLRERDRARGVRVHEVSRAVEPAEEFLACRQSYGRDIGHPSPLPTLRADQELGQEMELLLEPGISGIVHAAAEDVAHSAELSE